MSLLIAQIEEKRFLQSFLISKKNDFQILMFLMLNAWFFNGSEGVKSHLKFFCLRQKKSFKAAFRGLRL